MTISSDDLCDIEEIKQLKAKYFRYLDLKQWERLLDEVFTADAVFEGTSKPFKSAAEFVATNRVRLGPAKTVHQGHMPEIRLLGRERARGIWAMYDWVEFPEVHRDGPSAGQWGFTGYGHYHEEYRKQNGGWRIARLRLTRLKWEPLLGPGQFADLPPGRLRSEPTNWLEGGE
jgi:hypothetical protein